MELGQLVGCWHFDVHKMIGAQRPFDNWYFAILLSYVPKGVGHRSFCEYQNANDL